MTIGVKRRIPVTRRNPMREKRAFLIAAIDTETIELNGRLAMAQAYHEQWGEARVFKSVRLLLDMIFSTPPEILRKTIWYAHNASYDWRYLMEAFTEYMDNYEFVPCERATGQFYQINVYSREQKTKSGRPVLVTTFRDSMAVYNETLKKFTASFAPEFVKGDIGFDAGVVFDPKNATHVEYAKNDVVGLVTAIRNFDATVYEKFYVHLKGTFSSTAYQGWLRFAPEGVYHDRLPSVVEDFVRKSYYGGLVTANAPVSVAMLHCYAFDRNSSYPAAMRLGVPAGKPEATRSYQKGDIGFYECEVFVPDNAVLPIIPHRDDKDRLSWPTGLFKTKLSSLEIEHGRERGYSIKPLFGYRFPRLHFPFNDFIDVCERLRAEYKGMPTEIVVKFMQNSFYGRFGMKKMGRSCALARECPDGYFAIIDEETGRIIPNAFFKEEERDTEYMLPHYAAWITANARIALDLDTEAAGRENVRYRDTDSMTIQGTPLPAVKERVGKIYGQLKDEGEKRNFMVHAPKCCTWQALVDGTWVWKAVYKGIPKKLLTEDMIMAIRRGEKIRVAYNSTTSFATYMKTGTKQIARTRTSTDAEKIYGHDVENGWFRPRRAS